MFFLCPLPNQCVFARGLDWKLKSGVHKHIIERAASPRADDADFTITSKLQMAVLTAVFRLLVWCLLRKTH